MNNKNEYFLISDECVSCGACEAVCPTNAISQGDGKYEIDPIKCTACGSCKGQCPVEAISMTKK